MLHQVG